jgi:hypothetical protein
MCRPVAKLQTAVALCGYGCVRTPAVIKDPDVAASKRADEEGAWPLPGVHPVPAQSVEVAWTTVIPWDGGLARSWVGCAQCTPSVCGGVAHACLLCGSVLCACAVNREEKEDELEELKELPLDTSRTFGEAPTAEAARLGDKQTRT